MTITPPLPRPPRKNPLKRTPMPLVPSRLRSRTAVGLAVAAAQGLFRLQHCPACGAIAWPPRDACGTCLSPRLEWRDTDPAGVCVAQTVVRAPPAPNWREQGDWRVGTVVDAGPSIVAHLHGEVARGDRVRLRAMIDRSGQGVMMAMPTAPGPNAADDPQLRTLTAHPRHRRILITDARAAEAPALARALLAAGAAEVMLGEAEAWRPNPQREVLAGIEGVRLVPLDTTDPKSCRELAGEIGGRTDILIHNARFVRADALIGGSDTVFGGLAIQTAALGLMRLSQAFGPVMMARSEDGTNSAAAWVNLLPVEAMVPRPGFAAYSAAAAATLSLSRSLRAELRRAGIRVVQVFHGPTDDEWYRDLPPPKLGPGVIARGVVTALEQGLEEAFAGDIARDVAARWTDDPDLLIREMTGGGQIL